MKFEDYDNFVKTNIRKMKNKLSLLVLGVGFLNLTYIIILNIHYIQLSNKQQILAMLPLTCIVIGILLLAYNIKVFGNKVTNLLAMSCRESLEEFEKNGGKLKYEMTKNEGKNNEFQV